MKDFEKKIARLEQLAEHMRDTDLPLEKSFEIFEEGITLARSLKKELDELQGKVEVLLNSLEEDESPRTAAFEDQAQNIQP
ncbi:MAG: exodeoxyribonuclease VII small subunit [Spirochaetota bacterium]